MRPVECCGPLRSIDPHPTPQPTELNISISPSHTHVTGITTNHNTQSMTMLGGFGGSKPVDAEVAALISGLQGEVEKHLGASFATFKPHSVKTQVVAGVNYKCKVDVGGDQFCHVTVHQPLPHTKEPPKVVSAEGGKTLADEL